MTSSQQCNDLPHELVKFYYPHNMPFNHEKVMFSSVLLMVALKQHICLLQWWMCGQSVFVKSRENLE